MRSRQINIIKSIVFISLGMCIQACTNNKTPEKFQPEQNIIAVDSSLIEEDIDTITRESTLEMVELQMPNRDDEPMEEIVVEFEPIDTTRIYTIVEQMPQFPGGETEMYSYINKNLKYPEEILESGVQGRIVIRFVIHHSGKVLNTEILKSLHPKCDSAVLNVVNSMPDWIPGKQNGQNVSVYHTLPIMPHFR